MQSVKRHADWWFRDLNARRGKYVIAEPMNRWLAIFTVSIILALISYKGFMQFAFVVIAYIAIIVWGILEVRRGGSRFRKLLGYMALAAVAGALIMRLGLSI